MDTSSKSLVLLDILNSIVKNGHEILEIRTDEQDIQKSHLSGKSKNKKFWKLDRKID